MAFRGHEGFDAIANNADANPFDWGVTNGVGTSNPRYAGGQHCTGVGDGNIGVGWNLTAGATKVIQGGAFWSNFGSGGYTIFRIFDGSGNHQAILNWDTNNRVIRVFRGNGTTQLGVTSDLGIMMGPNQIWVYIEWEVVIDNAVGTIKVWLNGATTPVLDLNGLDTQATANAQATHATFIPPQQMDDIYLLDGSGAAPFNARLGDYRVYTLIPNTDDSIQWTRNTGGSNASAVDDSGSGGIDEDTTYVEDNTPGHIDMYGLSDLPAGAVPIVAEQRIVAKKTDAGTREMRMKLDSGGTGSDGPTVALSTSYTQFRRLMEKDPTDNAAWTKAKVDALKVGIEVVT